MSTFVTIGNAHNPFPRLLNAVERIAHLLPQPIIAQHGYTKFTSTTFKLVPFMHQNEFLAEIRNASVLLTHAGAGTIIHISRTGKIPVVMPRLRKFGEHVDD